MHDDPQAISLSEFELERLRDRIAQLERECQSLRKTDQALRQSEELNRRLVQTMAGGLVQVGSNGMIVSANAQAQRMLGLSLDDMSHRYVSDFSVMTIRENGDPYPVEEYPVVRCLRTGRAQGPTTIGLRHPDGSLIWADFTAAPLVDPSTGAISGAVVTFLDVTQRKDTVAVQHAAEQRYRRLIEGVRLIAWEFEPSTKQFTFVSHQAEEILGYPIDAWREPGFWYDHVHPADRDRAAAFSRERVASGSDHEFEYRMVHADGRVVWIKDITTIFRRGNNSTALQGVLIDVTQQRQIEESLRESEQRFRLAAEAAHGLIYDINFTTGSVYRSAGLLEITGHPPQESPATVEWWTELIHPDDRAPADELFNCALHDQPSYELEYRVRHRDGHFVHVWDRGLFLRDEHGQVVRCVGHTVDITHRKQAEVVLRRHADIIEQIHDAVIETTLEGTVTKWNKGAERIFGYSADEAVGQHIKFLYYPNDLVHRNERVIQPLLAKGKHEVELRMRRKSGATSFIHSSLVLLHDDAGAPKSIIGFAMDVTEHRRAEEALRRSEERLRAVLQNSPAAIYMKDLGGRYVEFNRQAEAWTGCPRDHAIGKTDRELFSPEIATAFTADDRRVQVSGCAIEVEELFPHQAGCHTHLTVKFPLSGPDGNLQYVCGISTDINERKRAEEGRRQSTELQRLMLSELDHRVRNNLASLAALVDISMRDKASVREFAESIRSRVQAMSSVHSLLSRGHWISVNLSSLIETLRPSELQGSMVIEGPEVKITPRQVTALGMVLQELMANSLKYGALGAKGGTLRLGWSIGDAITSKGLELDLTWEENGGPLIEREPAPGQGTGLIVGFVRTELRGVAELTYPRTGACHRFSLRLDVATDGR